MQETENSIVFKTGVIYALNKVQEMIANGSTVEGIEVEINHVLEKIIRDLGTLL